MSSEWSQRHAVGYSIILIPLCGGIAVCPLLWAPWRRHGARVKTMHESALNLLPKHGAADFSTTHQIVEAS
jgi:hypothetical protein